ncbi:MAG: hypothetical protein E7L17_10970 [Clostridium sp.]|uniref:hypothetical protein n=1 Tax=Clostridium sp. TaxID=1506 RepID=UPI0029083134|nr:hypothetical protein [Clostridium sp.]MDU7338622.1 hypothetical protein [Clostridium sp.]
MKDSSNIEQILSKINKCFESAYLNYKNNICPYDEVFSVIKPYKDSPILNDILIAIQEKIEYNENVVSYEKSLWSIMFMILPIYISLGTLINGFNQRYALIYILFELLLFLIILILFICAFKAGRKMLKAKSFYQMVYNILTQPECISSTDPTKIKVAQYKNGKNKHRVSIRKILP